MSIVNPQEKHRQIPVLHPSGNQIKVDQQLTKVLALAWQAGIETYGSCQDSDGKGTAHIAFIEWYDAERFLSIAAGEFSDEVDSLYNRIIVAGRRLPWYWKRWLRERCWRVEGFVTDWNLDYDEQGNAITAGSPEIGVSPWIFFPSSDLAAVEARLRARVDATRPVTKKA